MPNAQHTFASNTSSYQVAYDERECLDMIKNGFEAATMSDMTQEPNSSGCVACAIARCKQQSRNISLPKECDACFSEYCWRGPTAHNVTSWNNVTRAELGFGLKNMSSNVTWNVTTWEPFGNGAANLTAIVNQNQTNSTESGDSSASNKILHIDDSKVNRDSKHNTAAVFSPSRTLAFASLFVLIMIMP